MKRSVAVVFNFFLLLPAMIHAHEISFSRGYNAVGIPPGTGAPTSSTALIDQLGGKDKVISVSRYDAQTGQYQGVEYVGDALQGDPFDLTSSEGYVVTMKEPATLDYEASLTCPPSYDLEAGFNFIALACAHEKFTAYQLLNNLGGPSRVSAVQRYNRDAALFETAAYFEDEPIGPDFPLVAGEGYLVFMKEALEGWQPLVDTDGDGSPDSEDCEPEDETIYPLAEELCGDGIDNDCDYLVDNRDMDQDGYVSVDCGGDDWNDADPDANPGMPEICTDGIDNNSNGLVDGEDPSCGPGCDRDADGRPSPECGGVDYEDFDPTVYPDATEVCGDGLDNNLDGRVDEGCMGGEAYITPQDVKMLETDARLLIVLDSEDSGTEWTYKVNDIAGGNQTLGLIAAMEIDPSKAIYTAPDVSAVMTVTVSAVDPNNDARVASTVVTVYPVTGEYTVTPAALTLGLGRQACFSAGFNVDLVGFIPLARVYWKVNTNLGGNGTDGKIDHLGIYQAPSRMPDVLPHAIEVGFSLTPEGPVMAAAAVTLARLTVSPSETKSISPGPAGQLSAVLETSDGAPPVNPVPVGDLAFSSGNMKVAVVDAAGAVTIGDETGQSIITVKHKPTLAQDTAMVRSLSDIALTGELNIRSDDFARIERDDTNGVTEIEFTRPGAMFNFTPRATYLRGASAGDSILGIGEALSFSSTANVNVYTQTLGAVAVELPDGYVAHIESNTGFVTMGNAPGTGTITATYRTHGGMIDHHIDLTVIFTRLDMTVTAEGQKSESSEEVYITEFIKVNVELSNPTGSGFIGETPVRMSFDGSVPFEVSYGLNLNSGTGQSAGSTNNLYSGSSDESPTRFTLSAQSTEDPFALWWPPPGTVGFLLSPKEIGSLSIQAAIDNDPGKTPETVDVTVIRPRLMPGSGLDADAPIVVKSWVRIIDHPDDPAFVSIQDLYADSEYPNTVRGFARNDEPFWHILVPGEAEPALVPLTDTQGRFLTFTPTVAGSHQIYIGLKDRPELRSETLTLNVVEAGTVGDVTVKPQGMPLTHLFATFEIELPNPGPWLPGQTIHFRLWSLDASGDRRTVGETFYTGGESPQVRDHTVIGVQLNGLSGPAPWQLDPVSGKMYPVNTSGLIDFTVQVPSDGVPEGEDLIIQLTPRAYDLEPGEFAGVLNGSDYANDFGYAEFTEDKYQSYRHLYVRQGGTGLLISPREIPVASKRLRQYASNGIVDEDTPQVTFSVMGTEGFSAYDDPGDLVSADLGLGMTLITNKTKLENGRFVLTAETDEAFLDPSPPEGYEFGPRTIQLAFSDGRTWEGEIELYAFELDKPQDHGDINLPLNARHHDAHPVGSQVFRVRPEFIENNERAIQMLQLELIPSIRPDDDFDGEFRGEKTENPLVGFYRGKDPDNGAVKVTGDKVDLFHLHNAYFLVFGDITDRRRLKENGYLSDPGDPDLLPDFVSREADAEKLFLKIKGNVADCLCFSAYNVTAKVEEDLAAPQPHELNFDQLVQFHKMGETYGSYSGFSSNWFSKYKGRTFSVNNALDDTKTKSCVAVDVDMENNFWEYNPSHMSYRSKIPGHYVAGVTDQYFLLMDPSQRPGKDGRVHAFNGDREGGMSETGRARKSFGIELDGVLFDPTIGPADEDPNSEALLNLEVVEWAFPSLEPEVDSNTGLLLDQGGTSGGYFDIDREVPGSHLVVAKTPAAEFPGLHGGCLLNGKVEDIGDDDMADVIVKRAPKPDWLGRTPLVEETNIAGQTIGYRRVMGYANKHDRKPPIRTSLRAGLGFRITTDPAGLFTEEDAARVKAALLVRERPGPEGVDPVHLIVTTQSDGSEALWKLAYDTVVDLAVDLAAAVILNAVTGGGETAICGGGYAGEVVTNVINAAVGYMEAEMLTPYGVDSEPVIMANQVLNDGQPVIPGSGIKVAGKDVVEKYIPDEEVKKGLKPKWHLDGVKEIGLCSLLKAPFEALKEDLKKGLTIEDLGGEGAADAFGMRTLTVSIPIRPAGAPEGTATGRYNVQFNLSRRIDITPRFPETYELSQLLSNVPDLDLDPAAISDHTLVQALVAAARNPAYANYAKEIDIALNRMGVYCVLREPETHTDVYREYRMRYSEVPQVEAFVVPGMALGGGQTAPDFELILGETDVYVTAGSIVWAARSNQNAGARAAIRSDGIEMLLINASIQSPSSSS